jgi:NAD(P)-dependent dehydrogenase (short-subunit alcohol dehydrogenase family)
MDIKNKVVLITGGSEGIGKATAQLLASHGARVAVAARSIDKLRELVSNFSDGLAVEADMTQPESINRMIETVVEQYGRINILINNAGRALRAPIVDIKISDFEDIMKLNVYGPLLTMQAVIPHMKKNGGGMIVNISSNVSKMAIPTIGAYAATKYALNGLTLTARNELAEDNIVVSLMHPGLTATNFGKNALQYETAESNRPPGPDARPDTPEQVAEKILEAINTGPAEQYMSPAMANRFSLPTDQ